MCLFRKCDETIIETKEYPSMIERLRENGLRPTGQTFQPEHFAKPLVTSIKCAACGRIRIDQRSV